MSSTETWLCNVTLTIHTENDGPRVLKHGLEPIDTEVTLEEAVRRIGWKYVKYELIAYLETAIIKVRESGGSKGIWHKSGMDSVKRIDDAKRCDRDGVAKIEQLTLDGKVDLICPRCARRG